MTDKRDAAKALEAPEAGDAKRARVAEPAAATLSPSVESLTPPAFTVGDVRPARGTVTLRLPTPLHNHATMSNAEFERYVYGTVLPYCESRGIHMSSVGNETSTENGDGNAEFERYVAKRADHTLFDLDTVRFGVANCGELIQSTPMWYDDVLEIRRSIEYNDLFGRYISKGDLTLVFLLLGYEAQYRRIAHPTPGVSI